MEVITNINEWVKLRNQLPNEHTIGFAPTMGNLHAGHASLFLASSKEHQLTVTSLFINPTQFNQPSDFIHYPRTLEADIELMANSGVDFCILPEESDMYADKYNYQIHEQQLSQIMEGQYRPGHFNGVLTIVLKLLNLIRPHTAYFGEKDYQQYLLIKEMVNAFILNTEIKSCPTIRESSGLAYSSRNNRLSPEQKILAEQFAQIFHQDKPCTTIIEELKAQNIQVEYVEEYQNRRFAAVLIGEVRLIDNYSLE